MKIVIDIDEEVYECCLPYKDDIVISNNCNYLPEMTYSIANGIPLQKGHGKIGDFDVFLKGFLFDKRADHLKCGWIRELIERATIIEADKEEQE